MHNLLLGITILCVWVAGYAVGYEKGTRTMAEHVKSRLEVSMAQSERAYIPCDTDTDCLEKNGCGGYADPCEEIKP